MAQSFTIVDLLIKLFDWSTCFAISNLFKSKEKHPAREQEKKKVRAKVQTKDHTLQHRTHNKEP
jgi:hypothetical protein